jgi:hypothetical protein
MIYIVGLGSMVEVGKFSFSMVIRTWLVAVVQYESLLNSLCLLI